MGRAVRLSQVAVQFGTTCCDHVQIEIGNDNNPVASALSSFTVLQSSDTAQGNTTFNVTKQRDRPLRPDLAYLPPAADRIPQSVRGADLQRRGPRFRGGPVGLMPDAGRRRDGPSDQELLRRHVAGDSDAFGELFRRHRDRLWAVALRTVCDPEEAADALQDAMVSAFRRAADFRGESAVTTWLHRIVVNASLDRLRRRAARPALSAGDEQAFEALVAQDGDPARAADTRLDVDAALRILPPQQRAALVVVDMLGFSVADAAAILETSPGTVKSRCARARARLLPYVAHLQGNRSASESVSPAQGGDT